MARNSSQVSDEGAERRRRGSRASPPRARSPSKASVAIRSATVKPMPAIVPPPATAAQPTGGRSRPRVAQVSSQDATEDADRLADDVAEEDAERDRRRARPRQEVAVDRDAGVREREQRDDHVARPRVEQLLEPLVERASPTGAPRPPSVRAPAVGCSRNSRKRSLARSRLDARAGAGVDEQAHREPDDDRLDARTRARQPRRPRPARSRRARVAPRGAHHQHGAERTERQRAAASTSSASV